MRQNVDALVVAGVALLAYLNNLANGFVYDDRFIVEQNPLVQNLDWWGLFTASYWSDIVEAGLYRPLTLLSFGVNRALGESATGFHLVNDLLHAGASVVVLSAARALGASRFVSLAAALVFACHPLQTEAVDSLVGRAEILAFTFAIGAFVLYVRGTKPVLVAVLFFLALCSKESAAFAAPLFVFYWLLFERKNLVPIAGAVIAYAALRFVMLGSFGIEGRAIGYLDNPVADAPLATRVSSGFILLQNYVQLTLWPKTLSADYSFNQIPLTPDVRVLAGVIVVLALGGLAWKRRGLTAFAALAFVVPLTGFLHILFPLGTLFAERLMYLPMFGAALLIALALSTLPRRSWLLAILLLLSTVRVVSRNRDWRDNETLFRRTVETSPASARSHFLLGAELLQQKRYAEAVSSWEAGLSIFRHPGALVSHGESLLGAGEPVRAEAVFRDALRATPESEEIRSVALDASLAAGRQRAREGQWAQARNHFERALELDTANAEATNYMGLIAERQGDLEEARRLYQQALALDAEHVPAVLNLASVLMNTGELRAAEELFRRAVTLAPDSYEAYNGLGIALGRQGRNDEAEVAFRRAFEIDPSLDAARDNLRALGKTP